MTWNLADAKNRLSEVVNLALSEGPQTITRRKDAVVVISAERYAELTGQASELQRVPHERGRPSKGSTWTRDKSPMRDVEL